MGVRVLVMLPAPVIFPSIVALVMFVPSVKLPTSVEFLSNAVTESMLTAADNETTTARIAIIGELFISLIMSFLSQTLYKLISYWSYLFLVQVTKYLTQERNVNN